MVLNMGSIKTYEFKFLSNSLSCFSTSGTISTVSTRTASRYLSFMYFLLLKSSKKSVFAMARPFDVLKRKTKLVNVVFERFFFIFYAVLVCRSQFLVMNSYWILKSFGKVHSKVIIK